MASFNISLRFSLFFLLPVVTLKAQDAPIQSFFNQFELRQSFSSSEGKTEPVQFQMTFPKNGRNSFLVDGGIAYNFKGKNWKVFGEYHRNSLIEIEQHNWQAGLSAIFYSDVARNLTQTTYTRWFYSPTARYIRNIIDSVHSLGLNIDALPIRSGAKGLNLATNTFSFENKLIHFAMISTGAETQFNFMAKDKGLEGFIFRPNFKTQYSIAGNKRRNPELMLEPIKTWALTVNYDFWYDLVNTTSYKERDRHFFKGALDYYLLNATQNTNNINLTMGVSFNYGSRPQQGLKQQQFWLFTINFQK